MFYVRQVQDQHQPENTLFWCCLFNRLLDSCHTISNWSHCGLGGGHVWLWFYDLVERLLLQIRQVHICELLLKWKDILRGIKHHGCTIVAHTVYHFGNKHQCPKYHSCRSSLIESIYNIWLVKKCRQLNHHEWLYFLNYRSVQPVALCKYIWESVTSSLDYLEDVIGT
jgi:hypothetical protein